MSRGVVRIYPARPGQVRVCIASVVSGGVTIWSDNSGAQAWPELMCAADRVARAASLILEKHPYAGSEREGEELATLRQMVDAIPCIEFDPQEQRIGAPGRANPNDVRSGGDAV